MSPEAKERLRRMLIVHEGLRLKPYRCPAGYLTIGVGRNLEARGISREEAMVLLENDIAEAEAAARGFFPAFDRLEEPRQAVLVDMAFNLGAVRLGGFRRFWAALERGDFEQAAREMLDSKWAKQVGPRARRLAEMMRRGTWADDV